MGFDVNAGDVVCTCSDLQMKCGLVHGGENDEGVAPRCVENGDLGLDQELLVGGYYADDVVYSKCALECSAGAVALGERGVVIGPPTSAPADLLVKFPGLERVNVKISHVSRCKCGLSAGDVVYSSVSFRCPSGWVRVGDAGVVLGPSTRPDSDLRVRYPNLPKANATISQVSRLKGGYAPGEVVFSRVKITGAGGSVSAGDRGEVVGASKKRDLIVRFVGVPEAHCSLADVGRLPGGFASREIVHCRFDDEDGGVLCERHGEVLSAGASLDGADLVVNIPSVGHLNVKVADVTRLEDRISVGDVVYAREGLEHESVSAGDPGEVLAASSVLGSDLCVLFSQLRVNVKVSSVSRLRGGFCPGDCVFCVQDFSCEQGFVRVGDEGVVVGPPTAKHTDILVRFPNLARVNFKLSMLSRELPQKTPQRDRSRTVSGGSQASLSVPEHWSGRDHPSGWALISVDTSTLATLKQLFQVRRPEQLGKGLDSHRYREYRSLRVHCAWRVEHPGLWLRYASEKMFMEQQLAVLEDQGFHRDIGSTSVLDCAALPGEFSEVVSETMLLHGTKPENVLQVLHNGLNERLTSSKGAFGAGIYLAEDPEKVDQYTAPDPWLNHPGLEELHSRLYPVGGHAHAERDLFYCFVVRAASGAQLRTRGLLKTDSEVPPTRDCETGEVLFSTAERRELRIIEGSSPPLHYHSLRVDLGRALHRFREFVHFNANRTYCEYLVAYERI